MDASIIIPAIFFTVVAVVVAAKFLNKKSEAPAATKKGPIEYADIIPPSRALGVVKPKVEAPPVVAKKEVQVKAEVKEVVKVAPKEEPVAVAPVVEEVPVVEKQPAKEPEIVPEIVPEVQVRTHECLMITLQLRALTQVLSALSNALICNLGYICVLRLNCLSITGIGYVPNVISMDKGLKSYLSALALSNASRANLPASTHARSFNSVVLNTFRRPTSHRLYTIIQI